ncbi:Peroxidase 4 [Capsicum baccatum]|uniref:Peroxidase n=1 Tax=Capsicum baccatum TaxID=33114 RepID=A0A2G2VSJ6_CAPBA|nr:Peroxidase 4 [Capsicum baccatum]
MALSSSLSLNFYDHVCPQALPTLKRVVEDVVKQESRMSASLLCLHFLDCFVNGCEASILLDKIATIDSEKTVVPNNNSIRGFDVIDKIKSEVDKCCGHPIVSCTDIVAVAARDSVVAISSSGVFHEHLGGPTYAVPLGRRDSTTSSRTTTNNDIPAPFMDLPALIKNFNKQGLDEKDLVALSWGHTIGFSQCFTFRNLIYNETNIEPSFARQRQANCPRSGGDSKLAPLDLTPSLFDSKYFSNLVSKKGLLHFDQELCNGGQTNNLVKKYSINFGSFSKDFVSSMIKMGNIKPLT